MAQQLIFNRNVVKRKYSSLFVYDEKEFVRKMNVPKSREETVIFDIIKAIDDQYGASYWKLSDNEKEQEVFLATFYDDDYDGF
jgi:hypothetical protein